MMAKNGEVQRVEILPGVTVEIDTARWRVEGQMQIGLFGDDHEVYLDARVRMVETDEMSRIENLMKLRTE